MHALTGLLADFGHIMTFLAAMAWHGADGAAEFALIRLASSAGQVAKNLQNTSGALQSHVKVLTEVHEALRAGCSISGV